MEHFAPKLYESKIKEGTAIILEESTFTKYGDKKTRPVLLSPGQRNTFSASRLSVEHKTCESQIVKL